MSASGNSSASSGSKNNSTRPSRRFWEEDADDDPSTKLPEISEDTAVYLTTQRKTHGTVSYGGSRSLSGVSGRDPEREFKERVERQRRFEEEEDVVLQSMGEALQRLKGETLAINTELQEQNVLIREIDGTMSRLELAFQLVAQKVDRALQRTGLPYMKIILFQCIAIIIMFILIVYF